jgi:AhpD family alkylhydroperoxidase
MERNMQARIDVARVGQDAYKAMRGLQGYVNTSGLEKSLLELVKIRASQINSCAFCLHMHERELVDLTMAVVTINGWNRLMVAFRVPPAVEPSVTRL